LYENVTKVEVTQREIDQNLEYINSQQEELNNILDTYEKQIKEVFDESNLQQPMQPADTQREKAYGLAENLNSQLDDVNRNLNVMVEEINKMGSSRQISSDDDDVVRTDIRYIIASQNINFIKNRLVKLFKFSILTYLLCNGLILIL
jgi:nuclear pore complex protein Nup62